MHKKEDWCTVRATKQLHKCKKQVNEENDNTQGNLHFLNIFWQFIQFFFTFFELYEQGIQTCPASLAQEEARPTSEVMCTFLGNSEYMLSLHSKGSNSWPKHCVGPK